MSKKKKITVKHYLNTRLKPTVDDNILEYPIYISVTYDRMNLRIPSNIFFNSSIEDFETKKFYKNGLSKLEYEKDLIKRCVEKFKNDEDLKKLRKDFYLLYPLKKYRSKNERQNIFSSYIDFYTHSIYMVVSDYLRNEIKDEVLTKIKINGLDIIDKNRLSMLISPNSPELYQFIKKNELDKKYEFYFILWSRFNSYLANQGSIYGYDMPYLDWIENKGQPLFKNYLKKYERETTDCWSLDFFNDENIKIMIKIIEEIIFKEDYFKKRTDLYTI
jgi:hypothetical protein